MEKYEEAATTYEGLAGGDDDEFQQEHITNRLASLAGRLASEAVPPAIELPDGSDEYEMFEQTYNTTCILLALGRVKQALDFVLKSLEQCRAILESEPDIDEDEIEDELALLLGSVSQGDPADYWFTSQKIDTIKAVHDFLQSRYGVA